MNGMKHVPTRTLGRDGPEVSIICLGTWGLGGGMGAIEEKQAIRTVHAALRRDMTTSRSEQAQLSRN